MKRTIGEIAEIVMGQSPKSEFYNNNGDGMPFLQGNRTFGDLYPTFDTYTTNPTKTAKAGDIIMSVRAPVGDLNITPVDMCLGRGVCALRMKNGNQSYLFYLLKHNVKTLINRESGTVFGSVNYKDIASLVVDYEENEEEQRRIGQFLWDIDQKIETNKAINNNLMQQIQSLFSDWFVTFTPFGGNKPSSWNKTDIYAISKVIYGAPFASKAFNTERNGVPIIRIRDLKEQQLVTYTTETHPKGYLLKPGDVVVGMDGEFRPYIWGNDKAWLNQRVCVFENKRPNGKAFLYCVIKPLLYTIEQTQVGTTVIHIGKKDFDSFEFWLPEDCVLDKFDSLTNPMYQQIVFSLLENKKLMVLRDTLLPKLLSGEINVSDIEL